MALSFPSFFGPPEIEIGTAGLINYLINQPILQLQYNLASGPIFTSMNVVLVSF